MPILKKPLATKGALLVWDTETTGLLLHPEAELRKQPKIIEFGAALLSRKDGSLISEHSMLMSPGEPLEPIIVKITGLTDDDLHDQRSFAQCLPDLRAIFAQATAMCAHNLPFDKAMLENELARSECTDFPWPAREACTIGLYRPSYGHDMKMKDLYQDILGKPLAQTHRALDDVRALVEIVQAAELWRIV